MSFSKKLSGELQPKKTPLSYMEFLTIQFLRDFPQTEQLKLIDLLHRFSMAKKYTGELHFNLTWLEDSEVEYDAMIDLKQDVLKGILKSKILRN